MAIFIPCLYSSFQWAWPECDVSFPTLHELNEHEKQSKHSKLHCITFGILLPPANVTILILITSNIAYWHPFQWIKPGKEEDGLWLCELCGRRGIRKDDLEEHFIWRHQRCACNTFHEKGQYEKEPDFQLKDGYQLIVLPFSPAQKGTKIVIIELNAIKSNSSLSMMICHARQLR